MRVVNIIQRYAPAIGGSEVWCKNVCNYLARKGIFTNVETINVYNMDEVYRPIGIEEKYVSLGEFDNDFGVVVKRYKLWRFCSSIFSKIVIFLLYKTKIGKTQLGEAFKCSPHSFEMYQQLYQRIRKSDVVILHTLPYFHTIVGYIYARILRKPFIIVPHFHPGHPHYEKNIFFTMMRKSNGVIVVSEYEKDYLEGKNIPPSKILVTGNCIEDYVLNEDKFKTYKQDLFIKHGIDEKAKCVIFLGRKEIYKGIDCLIKAMQELAKKESNLKFFLFLVGPDTQDFIKQFPSFDQLENLKIIDFGCLIEDEKQYLLKISQLLVLPSKFEAFGIVFLEAWRYKKPVIGSDRGAMPSVVKDGGLIAEYGSVNDLKDKIKKLLFNPDLAEKLGEAGKKKLDERFSIEKIGGKLLTLCQQVKKNRKVIIVSHLFPPHYFGGAEIVAYEQAKMLKKIGWDVYVLTGRVNNEKKQYSLEKSNYDGLNICWINLWDADLDKNLLLLNKTDLLEQFYLYLEDIAPDIVHFHNISAFSLQLLDCCKKFNLPIVMTLHDYWALCFKNTLMQDYGAICDVSGKNCNFCQTSMQDEDKKQIVLSERNKIVAEHYRKVDMFISPSVYLTKQHKAIFHSNRFEVINNGINLEKFCWQERKPKNKLCFGFVGRVSKHKGMEVLLESFSALSKEERKIVRLFITGTGEDTYFDFCKTLVYDSGLSKVVKFNDKVDRRFIKNIFRQFDVLIVPSIWPENSPVSIHEAFAMGISVLASDIGGIPELIEDGVNGFLHPHDNPEILTKNIRRFIQNPNLIKKMEKSCVDKAYKYDLLRQANEISKCYNSLIKIN